MMLHNQNFVSVGTCVTKLLSYFIISHLYKNIRILQLDKCYRCDWDVYFVMYQFSCMIKLIYKVQFECYIEVIADQFKCKLTLPDSFWCNPLAHTNLIKLCSLDFLLELQRQCNSHFRCEEADSSIVHILK